ncbi:hypothetical protein K1719_000248 [Acacia pycnantha]|nr:hypothetical protein K1719_000248 [Acacia pycnantha]
MTPIKKKQPLAQDVFVGNWKPTKNDMIANCVPGFRTTMNILYDEVQAIMRSWQAKTSSIHYHWMYDVFLNFRGEDTRHGFTGHLYDALNKMGIRTFFDDEEIRMGDKIPSTLLKAIEESRMAITIFSKEKDYERVVIKEIVNGIVGIIKERDPLDVAQYPVGLTSRIEKINSLLQLGSNDKVFMVGICGLGGMGKTTIAHAVYNAIADHFEYLCFLDDIKGESEKHGLQQQQAKMLSKISGRKEVIEDIDEGVKLIKRVLKGKKTLLILDNVDEQKQLQKLAGTCECALKYVNKMVACARGFDPHDHIEVLKQKCLITIKEHSYYIRMHDLVRNMGREIVRQESPIDPEKRSRLWSSEDIVHVLEGSEGTSEVFAIIQVESSECIEIDWDGTAFKNMKNLKIIILENAKFSQGPKYLPNSLAILRWRGYPSSSLPDGFRLKHLVEFDVGDSNFKSIMEAVNKMIPHKANVSVLNFSRCEYIEKMPNLSGLPSLKELHLRYCTNLIEIDNSVGQLPKLEILDVGHCTRLRTLPSELNTPSLVYLELGHCTNLDFFPEIVTREIEIDYLSLYKTGIDQLPPSVENLTKLCQVGIVTKDSRVRSMKLPSSFFLLSALEQILVEGVKGELIMEVESIIYPNIRCIELKNCNISNENLWIRLAAFSNFCILDLTGSDFTILPACIEDCRFLDTLVLDKCKYLIEVEKVPPSTRELMAGDCTSLSLESKKLLLSKELLASVVPINRQYISLDEEERHFCVPGGSIPEWFDHCSKGSSISCWFLDQYFPTYLIICAIYEAKGGYLNFEMEVFIDEKACINQEIYNSGCDGDHIIVDYISKFQMEKLYERGKWKHAKICFSSPTFSDAVVKESGIYVVRDKKTNMENIRFTDPFLCSDLLTNDQGCTIEGETSATNNPFSPSQCERQHTHSHAVLDIDGLRQLSVACGRQTHTFPVSILMDPSIVGSKPQYDIIIFKEDVMEFLNMQELCITIIQLFVKFANTVCCDREIHDRFGFLCPNAVQSVGNMREGRISYIGSSIKEGNKQCWLAPIREGNHWTLCVICPESNIIYWFDSLGREQSDDIEKIFTEALEMYHIVGENNTKWLCPNYRRQLGDKECGYYVMGYMYDIIDLNQVHSLDTHFKNLECYTQEDINFIRNMWSDYFLKLTRMWLDSDDDDNYALVSSDYDDDDYYYY